MEGIYKEKPAVANLGIRLFYDALEAQAGVAGNIIGVESILTTGTLADGTVYVKLRGDAIEPGTTRYYGTGPDGTKGWHAIADALDAAADACTGTAWHPAGDGGAAAGAAGVRLRGAGGGQRGAGGSCQPLR